MSTCNQCESLKLKLSALELERKCEAITNTKTLMSGSWAMERIKALEQKLAVAVEAFEKISNIEIQTHDDEDDDYLTLEVTRSIAGQALALINPDTQKEGKP